jgi:glycosyltransferase involved in cell wall biosynthesis
MAPHHAGSTLAEQLVLNSRDDRDNRLGRAGEGEGEPSGPPLIAVVLPVYKDWPSFARLLEGLDRVATAASIDLTIVAVNDCPGPVASPIGGGPWSAIRQIEILHLTRNLGHQRAIAVGLSHVEVSIRCDAVAVMDADGEDQPEDLIGLVQELRNGPAAIVVAQRRKRSEGKVFRWSYRLYKTAFRLLTGQNVDFGNFCVIPRALLVHVVSMSEIWSNFPAGLIQSRLPIRRLPTARGTRYEGRSTMNFVSLVMHGLGAISVFSDSVFIRVTLLSLGFLAVTCMAIAAVLVLKVTGHATPGWASNLAVSLSILAVQMLMLSVVAAFMVLNNRTAVTVIPRLTYRNFIMRRELVAIESAKARAIA